MKIKTNEVIFRKELYPRIKVNIAKVQEYEELLEVMPKIIVNQDKVLIDGTHRWYAYKNKKIEDIEVEVIETVDDDDIMLKAIELNASHGFQLTYKEKKNEINKLYQKVLDGSAKSFDVKRLKTTFAIPDSTFSDWTKDVKEEVAALQLQKILSLYLQNKTQQEIAEEVGLSQKQIGIKIKEIEEKIDELYQNPNSEIGIKYGFLREKTQLLVNFKPYLYNLWRLQSNDSDNLHFGKFPETYMENLLYYFTKPFDVIYDPFAGGGVTIDCCEKWFRKHYVSDAFPIEIRKDEIRKWKIQDGLPKDLPKPNFVFLDPPYWKQAEGKYSDSKDDLGNVELVTFYEVIFDFLKELKKKMEVGSRIAFVIQPSQWKMPNKEFEDHIIKIMNSLKKLGFEEEMRIVLPYPTQQYLPQQVNIAKEQRICLSTYRDLVIFKKL